MLLLTIKITDLDLSKSKSSVMTCVKHCLNFLVFYLKFGYAGKLLFLNAHCNYIIMIKINVLYSNCNELLNILFGLWFLVIFMIQKYCALNCELGVNNFFKYLSFGLIIGAYVKYQFLNSAEFCKWSYFNVV